MKYLIFSDIHGSLPRLQQMIEVFEREHCDMMLILGDLLNYGPRNGPCEGLDAMGVAELLNQYADRIVAVRGNCDSEVDQMLLRFPIMQTTALLVDEGRKILLTHGHVYNRETLPPGHFDLVCYGHTHRWLLEQEGTTTFLNTGSITFPKGGNPPTYAVLQGNGLDVCAIQGGRIAHASWTDSAPVSVG